MDMFWRRTAAGSIRTPLNLFRLHSEHRMEATLTQTEQDQIACEESCLEHLCDFVELGEKQQRALQAAGTFNENGEVRLMRERHTHYVLSGLHRLSSGFTCLDASRPWLCYWMLHSVDLLKGVDPEAATAALMRDTLATVASFQNAGGGMGGGPQQVRPNQASVCVATCTVESTTAFDQKMGVISGESAYDAIDRGALYRWFMSLKHPNGGFRMHDDGEVDVRGTYTVISIASLLNILTPELTEGVAEYLLSCQTYEGGFGGNPGYEAHGGYVFCAFAALTILGRAHDADVEALEAWLCHRQLPLEGGFQGRTNKLVDGCYSFWQGATAVLISLVKAGSEVAAVGWEGPIGHRVPYEQSATATVDVLDEDRTGQDEVVASTTAFCSSEAGSGNLSVSQHSLQRYLLLCSQTLEGGLRDKPGKPRDFYHTCYCLSGLSCAQWGDFISGTELPAVYGDVSNLLPSTSPVYNIKMEKATRAIYHFAELPLTHQQMAA